MRANINVCLYVLAVSNVVLAEKIHERQHADLLKDLSTISRYWGAFSHKKIF
jgi:hypothetical protein